MDTRLSLMDDDKEKLVDEILDLRRRNEDLFSENEKLRLEVEALKKKADEKTRTAANKNPNFLKTSRRPGLPPHRWGRKPGHAGVTRPKPTHIDREVVEGLSACPDCHHSLGEPVETTEHIQEDIVPARVEVTRFLHHRYWCRGCDKMITAPYAPDEVPRGYLGPLTLATMVWLKYHLALPANKVQAVLHDLCGMKVSEGAVTQALQRLAGYLRIESDQIMAAIKTTPVKHVDDTGWTVNGVAHWLWAFVNDKWAHIRVDKSRGSQVPINVLGKTFQGVLVSDFLGAYNSKIHGAKQKCLVHLRRDIRESRGDHPPPDFTAPEKKLQRLLADAERLADRRNRFSPLVFARRTRRIKDRPFLFATQVYSNATWRRLSARLLTHYKSIFTFLDVPGLASHNNAAERTIKPHVIIRNRSYQNRTPAGADAHGVLTSLLQTLLLQKRPVLQGLAGACLHHRQWRPHLDAPAAAPILFSRTSCCWKLLALGSAFFAGMTAVLSKIGVKDISPNLATLIIRTTVIMGLLALPLPTLPHPVRPCHWGVLAVLLPRPATRPRFSRRALGQVKSRLRRVALCLFLGRELGPRPMGRGRSDGRRRLAGRSQGRIRRSCGPQSMWRARLLNALAAVW